MSEERPHATCEIRDGIGIVTLDRPEQMNAFTWRMGREVDEAFRRCDADDKVRAVVVTGAGRAFCAGADLSYRGGDTFSRSDIGGEGPPKTRLDPWHVRKPIIAAINGAAIGVGLTMPLQYDLRVAARDAKLAFAFVRRGVVPELASTWILPRLIGMARASDLLISGRVIRGEEAAQIGLVNEAVEREHVLDRALEIAADIARSSAPVSVAMIKRMLWEHLGVDDPAIAQEREARVLFQLGKQPDCREGVKAFLEKRDPDWTLSPTHDLPKLDPL